MRANLSSPRFSCVLRKPVRTGIEWDQLRGSEAPELLPEPEQPQKEFDWELSSLAAALPTFITGDGEGSPSPLQSAAAALLGGSPPAKAGSVQTAAVQTVQRRSSSL